MVSATSEFTTPDTSSLTQVAYLVGTPIAHSGSPSLHRNIYDAVNQPQWAQLLCETSDLHSFITYLRHEPKAMGSGVTMPYKVAVIPYLDEMTPEAKAIGAVNTIYFRSGPDGQRLFCGTNTDCIGVRDAFLTNVPRSIVESFRGKPGLVVGGGGTCRAAVYSLQRFLGCSSVYIINRDKSEVDAVLDECRARGTADNLIHVETVEQAQGLAPPIAIVSAVPDFTPQTHNEKAARETLRYFVNAAETKGALLEMCYHPSANTQITQLAEQAGWQVVGGIEAMIGQGMAQAHLWTGVNITDEMRVKARNHVLARNSKKLAAAPNGAAKAPEPAAPIPVPVTTAAA